jgi:fructokinase
MADVIVGLGEILWDVFPTKRELGGAPANFVYLTSQFGFDGYVVSAVGQDKDGDDIVESLRIKELRHHTFRSPYPTGTVQVELDGDGVPEYTITENVAWDNIPYTEQLSQLAEKTKAVCFGSLAQRSKTSRQTINRFLEKVPSDALRIFDINLRAKFYSKELIVLSLKHCNILKINSEELVIVAGLLNVELQEEVEFCKYLLAEFQLRIVILTRGVNGSYVITESETSFKPTPSIVVIDTVGAGDAFSAAFISAVIKNKSIRVAHKFAVEVAAFVCTQRGAMPLLPDYLIDFLE